MAQFAGGMPMAALAALTGGGGNMTPQLQQLQQLQLAQQLLQQAGGLPGMTGSGLGLSTNQGMVSQSGLPLQVPSAALSGSGIMNPNQIGGLNLSSALAGSAGAMGMPKVPGAAGLVSTANTGDSVGKGNGTDSQSDWAEPFAGKGKLYCIISFVLGQSTKSTLASFSFRR